MASRKAPVDAEILTDEEIPVRMPMAQHRPDRIGQQDALRVFLLVFHKGSIRLGELCVIG